MAACSTDKSGGKHSRSPLTSHRRRERERGRCFKGQMTFTRRRKIDREREREKGEGAIEGNATRVHASFVDLL